MTDLGALARQPEALDFCRDYAVPADAYDEMCGTDGELRAHWRYVVESLEGLGEGGLARRWRETRRLIRDNGVTYNVYGDPQGMSRPWELDLVPYLITSEDWARIERGLIQRAELLNLLLADLYGPRSVINTGILPPELIYSHAGFLRPCAGTLASPRRPLVSYAVDLTRGRDGEVWVMGDRAQVPSGAGYALENRIVLSRALPSLFRDSQVHRLAGFFRAMRGALAALAPRSGDPPRTVVLTPGPRNETYFEHAYLASYLGYTLAQGSDLSVREGGVFLQSLEGLQRVDVILRRVDDDYCDPLELREDSYLGVPGLVQAVRNHQVTIANPLGSGVLDNPALLAYMPQLCRNLLGEDLLLPVVPTWWCGDGAQRGHVLANLAGMVIKPVRPGRGERSVYGAELDDAGRQKVREAILANPPAYVGQEQLALSTTPVLVGNRLEPRPAVLRSFLTGREDGYVVMPGGLTRAAPSRDNPIVSNQSGGIGKDTWVIASEPEKQESLLTAHDQGLTLAGSAVGIPSRVVDNLFWIGRYTERAEALVRLLRTIILQVTEQFAVTETGVGDACRLHHLLRALTHQTCAYPGFVGEGAEAHLHAPEGELLSLVSEATRNGSLPQVLNSLLQAARSVRDYLSTDTWRVVNDIDQELNALVNDAPAQCSDALDTLDALVTALVAFAGLTAENMAHGPGWVFLEVGRRLERAGHGATLLRTTVVPVVDPEEEGGLLEAVLAVTDSLIAYRRHNRAGMRVEALLDLVLLDESNPRALAYQVAQLQTLVGELPRAPGPAYRSAEERLVLEALTELRLADADRLAAPGEGGALRSGLDQLLSRLGRLLPELSSSLTQTWFHKSEPPHQLVQRPVVPQP